MALVGCDGVARAPIVRAAILACAPGFGQGHGPMGFPLEPFRA
jgi:hypothetical protein